MKPSDFFLGIIDFFATLVPGAIVAYLLLVTRLPTVPAGWPRFRFGSPEGWVLFTVAAFVLGHFVSAIGSHVLDPLYDRSYARWRRASAEHVRSKLGIEASWIRVMSQRLQHVKNRSNPDDALLSTAKAIKIQQLQVTATTAGTQAAAITNTYWWAATVVRLRAADGSAEIDRLTAQSKLFRALIVTIPLAAYVYRSQTSRTQLILFAFFLLVLCLWRFFVLRWDATERTYEYFIATSVVGSSPAPPSINRTA